MRRFSTVQEWLQECKRLPKQDLDNVMLVTGAEGAGKSTLAYQIAKALDPNFDLSHVAFSIGEYVSKARHLAKGEAVMSDEFLANKRKGMHGGTISLLDFLQECRGLNLHHLILFPHFDLLDKAVRDYRVRWHLYIPRRGLFHIKEKFRYFSMGGVEEVGWRTVASFNFTPNKGDEWQSYLTAKSEHMTSRSVDTERDESSVGYDLTILATFPGKYEQTRREFDPRRKLA